MPVSTPHPNYVEHVAEWQRCRDACGGEDDIKSRAETYLPKPSGMDASDYRGYIKRASYFEAVPRTVAGFVGAIARKPAKVTVPPAMEELLADVTADGISMGELTMRGCEENILQGRAGFLVDYDETKKRSFIKLYPTESIINWWDGGVVLKEIVFEADAEDRFKQVAIEQYRELSISDGAYTVNLWRKDPKATASDEWIIVKATMPTRAGQPMDALPFFWLTPKGKTNTIEKPPMLGLVNLAIAHFCNSADLEHGRHFSGMPTLYVTGATDPDMQIRIGSCAAIIMGNENAKVAYADFSGDGLGSLERGMADKEGQMAALGAAVFQAAHRKGVEAAETARIRISGENSLLTGVVGAVEESLTAALKCASEWMRATGDVSVELNRDFVSGSIEPQLLQGMVQAFQAGAYSLDSFLFALQKGELIPPDQDLDEEKKKVIAEAAVRASQETALAVKVKSASGNTAAV